MSSGRSTCSAIDLSAHGLEPLGGVGQVILVLGVAGADLVEGLPEQGKLEDVAARVDLADGLLLGRAVALLDDPEESSGGVAEDAAEAHRVVDLGGAQQAGGLLRAPGGPAGRPGARAASSGSSPTRTMAGPW